MKQELLESCLRLENGIVTHSRAGGGAGSILLVAINTNIPVAVASHIVSKKFNA